MNITSITTTMTAIEHTDRALFRIDYSFADGKLQTANFNIYKPSEDENSEGEYIGSIHLQHNYLNCNVPMGEDVPHFFEAVADFIHKIMQTLPPASADAPDTETGTKHKTSK